MSIVPSLEQILNQKEEYSSLSEEPSFTLTDILEEPLDEELIEDDDIGDDIDEFFQDEDEADDMFDDSTATLSKVYEFPSLEEQKRIQQQQNQSSELKQPLPQEGSSQSVDTPKIINSESKITTSKVLRRSTKTIESSMPQIKPYERLKSMPMLPLEQIENMSFVKLKNVTNLFEDANNTSIGIPTAISASGNRFLAVGTSMGNIVVFQIGVKGNKILGTPEQKKYGSVLSLSISRDNKYLVAGHQSGLVTLWDMYYFTLIKQQLNSRSKILQVLFCSQTSQNFISNDIEGNTYIYSIEKYIWINLKSQRLMPKSASPFYDIRYHELQSKNCLLALCSLDYILLISIKPQINVIGKIIRPDGISLSHLPNVQMGRCFIDGLGYKNDVKPMYDVLVVSWGKSVYVYRFIPSANSFCAIEQLFVYKHPTVVYNIEFLSENVFVTLDHHQVFRTLRIDITIPSIQSLQEIQQRRHPSAPKQITSSEFISISMPPNTSKQPAISCNIIHSKQMSEEIIYQRLLKNKEQKYIKSFRNTVINCIFNSQHKEIFFISKNSIFRARLHKWTTFLSSIVNEQKKFTMAMKLAIQLKNERLNIFAQKVQLTGKRAQKTMKMLCDVGKIFFEESLKDLKQVNIQRARNRQRAEKQIKEIAQQLKQIYEYVIEYFIELKCEKYLFENIFEKIIKNLPSFQYWELFIESLKPFIDTEKLVRIPSIEVFKEILDYLSEKKSNSPNQDNMKLIDKMVTNLESESLHYENAVSILADNKLYKGLAYICSVNKDFVSPCNKLLTRMIEANEAKHENAQKQYYEILDLYLTKLINGLYINDKKISARIYETHVLKDISLWLSFEDTLSYFFRDFAQNQSENEQIKISNKFKTILQWISKLLQTISKLREKHNFHELTNHLFQALCSMQNKEMMKKSTVTGVSRRDQIIQFKYQLSLMLVKLGGEIDLNDQELSFYVKTQYECRTRPGLSKILGIDFIKVKLNEELSFMRKYFELLHLIKVDGYIPSEESRSAYQQICKTKDDWCKYLYNFLVDSISIKKKQTHQNERQVEGCSINEDKGSMHQNRDQELEICQNSGAQKGEDIKSEPEEVKSQKLEQKSDRVSQSGSSVHSAKFSEHNKLIESLFSPGAIRSLELPSESSILKRREQQTRRIKELKLVRLDLERNLEESKFESAPVSNSCSVNDNNYILVELVLSTFEFEEIDPHIESLIKLNSELVIVYILEHYELDVVNKKIQLISDEQTKYFVVRRILKITRKIKKANSEQSDLAFARPYHHHHNSIYSKSKEEDSNPFKVWGNQRRENPKKNEMQNQFPVIHKSSSCLDNAVTKSLSKEILLFYLECLAMFKRQKRVLYQLKHNYQEYQCFIEQVLDLVKKYQLNSCIGLIYENMKDLDKAFESYKLVYNERMEVNVRKLVLVQHCHGRFLRQIFNQMLDICLKINTNRQWMSLLEAVLEPLIEENKFVRRKKEAVIDLIQKVYSANPNHAFIQQFGEVIQNTLLEVSSHTPTEQISSVFSEYSELMNKTFMLNCLKSTMHTYSKSIFIYETANSMVVIDQANEFDKIYQENKIKGLNCMPICEQCDELIQHSHKIALYKCSHMYHKSCIPKDQDKCRKCALVEVGQISNEQYSMYDLDQLKTKKKESSLKVIEVNPQVLEQKQATPIPEEEEQIEKTNTIYRSLAFEEFMEKDQSKFDQFRKDYDTYLSRYQ